MSACDTDSPLRHSTACRDGYGRACRASWCECACHSSIHRSVAARAGRAQSAASERAGEELARIIMGLAASGQQFSSVTVRPLLPPDLSGNQVGAAFAAASAAGLIEPVPGELHRVDHRAGHSRIVRVWRGTAKARALATGRSKP